VGRSACWPHHLMPPGAASPSCAQDLQGFLERAGLLPQTRCWTADHLGVGDGGAPGCNFPEVSAGRRDRAWHPSRSSCRSNFQGRSSSGRNRRLRQMLHPGPRAQKIHGEIKLTPSARVGRSSSPWADQKRGQAAPGHEGLPQNGHSSLFSTDTSTGNSGTGLLAGIRRPRPRA